LDDLTIVVSASSSGAQAQAAMGVHDCDSPTGWSSGCECAHAQGDSYG
jgi:hypothetical protein